MSKKVINLIDKHVGNRVRMRRKMIGMSMQTLAKPLSVTWQQLQKQELGTNRIGASRLRQIAQILDVPESFFFEGAPNMPGHTAKGDGPSPAVISDFLATTDGLTIATNFGKIKDQKMRRHLADLVERIAEA